VFFLPLPLWCCALSFFLWLFVTTATCFRTMVCAEKPSPGRYGFFKGPIILVFFSRFFGETLPPPADLNGHPVSQFAQSWMDILFLIPFPFVVSSLDPLPIGFLIEIKFLESAQFFFSIILNFYPYPVFLTWFFSLDPPGHVLRDPCVPPWLKRTRHVFPVFLLPSP